jgi:hypothetical protein
VQCHTIPYKKVPVLQKYLQVEFRKDVWPNHWPGQTAFTEGNLCNKKRKGGEKKTQRKNSVKPGNGVEPEPAPQLSFSSGSGLQVGHHDGSLSIKYAK